MSALVDETQKIQGIAFDYAVHEKRKWAALATRKAMRPHVISTTPSDHRPCRFFYAVTKLVAQP